MFRVYDRKVTGEWDLPESGVGKDDLPNVLAEYQTLLGFDVALRAIEERSDG